MTFVPETANRKDWPRLVARAFRGLAERVTTIESSGGGGGIGEAPQDGTPYSRQNAGWVSASVASVGWGAITGTLSSQTDLQSALDGKQAAGSYANAVHSHVIGDVTGLQAALDGKQAAGSYALASHGHVIADVTGLQAALNAKQDTLVSGSTIKTINGESVLGSGDIAVGGGGGGSVYSYRKRSSTDASNAAPTLIIPWDTDEGSSGSDVTYSGANPTRLTIATTGVYKVGGVVTFRTTQQRGQATAEILINGTPTGVFRGGSYVRNSGSSWDYWPIEVSSEPFSLTAGDYVELRLVRNSGANGSYNTGGSGTITHRGVSSRFWVERMI